MLVALDDSPRAPLVFETGTELARLARAEVFLVRVLMGPPDIPPAAHTHVDHLEGDLEGIVRSEFRRLMDTASDIRFGPPIIVDGDPWRRILDVARQVNVDLIVIGSHRHHGIERVLGTVASRVVNHADRNVLVVRDRKGV